MADRRLVIVDPGHFHAALIQKKMLPGLSPDAHVYAPLGRDLIDYLAHIERFNNRVVAPTSWRLAVHAGDDFLDRFAQEPPGAIVVFAGRNRGKIERIRRAVQAGMHVLADKPAIIDREDLPVLEEVLDAAKRDGLVVRDLMAGRHDSVGQIMRALMHDPDVFGEPLAGSIAEPTVEIDSVHHLMKEVAGVPGLRPAWYFDITEQGEGLADIGTHLVDRVHNALFPGEAIDWRDDIRLLDAARWPTMLSLTQFREVTGEAGWPDFLGPWLRGDDFEYFCNMRATYAVRGVHVRLEARWNWQAPHGDTRSAVYRGSRARLELRQGTAESYRPELYVVPQAEIAAALERRITTVREAYPGIRLVRHDGEWQVEIPAALRLGHDAHFTLFAGDFLRQVADPNARPAWETPNMMAKYFACTEAVALSHQ